MNDRVVPARVAAARQLDHIAPQQVLDLITGHPAERLIDCNQRVIGVKNHDPFTGRLKHRRRQLPLLFQVLAGADVAASADHSQDPPAGAALHGSPTVFDPHPVAITMTHTVFDLIILGAPLQMFHQRPS
ncbi:hypothetical protein D3C86_1833930 [compost metagenome]